MDYIVEGENPPLAQLPDTVFSQVDESGSIYYRRNGGRVLHTAGNWGMPNAVGKMIADSDLKDLGCHTEMLVDAYVDMFEVGRLTNAKKNIDP